MQIDIQKINRANNIKRMNKTKSRDDNLNKTLKGVLINNHIQNTTENFVSFDDIEDTLLIMDAPNYYSVPNDDEKELSKESSFNENKAMKPLLIGTGLIILGSVALSLILKKSSQAKASTKIFEQLPDLAINMNIKEEPQFAIYRAIRDPNFSNIMGAAAIFIMSGITIASKNFVDGAKEIWLKKQSCDIEKNLQENLISVETNSFSGKLNVVNSMLNKNVKYFDSVLNNKMQNSEVPQVFSNIVSFKGKIDKTKEETENTQKANDELKRRQFKKNLKYVGLISGILIGAIAAAKFSISSIRKAADYSQKYANNFTEGVINTVNAMSEKADKNELPKIIEMLKSICAKPEYIKDIGKKYNLSEIEIQNIIHSVEETKKTIFADAPTALGGIPKKIQYYCYIDENRGHLYNWILNPDNKFTKYIFLAFTASSAIGYVFKQALDALKEAAVLKENAKTELDLRKRLVDVEIKNFKSKKESAIQPLIDNFKKEIEAGNKSKEELKQLADNILNETKNGPPYVYT